MGDSRAMGPSDRSGRSDHSLIVTQRGESGGFIGPEVERITIGITPDRADRRDRAYKTEMPIGVILVINDLFHSGVS